MKKRIVSLLMILTLVLTLVACGGKDKTQTLTQAFEKQVDMKTGVSDITIDFSFSGFTDEMGTDASLTGVGELFNNLSLKISTVSESVEPLKGSASISYKYGTATDYSKLTTFIMDGDDIYINANELKVAVTAIATEMGQPQVGILLTMFQTEEYIKINQKEMNDYISKYAGVEVTEAVTTVDQKATEEAGIVIARNVIKAFEEVTKEVKPELVSAKDSKVTLTITKENVDAVADAIGKADLTTYYDTMVKELEAVKGAEDITKEVKESKETVLAKIKEFCVELTKEEPSSDADAKVVYSIETKGNKGSRVATNEMTINFKDEKDTLDVVVKAVTNEKIADDQKVVVPEKATTVEELMNTLTEMLGGM